MLTLRSILPELSGENLLRLVRKSSTVIAIAILTLTFIAATSGILMAFYYQPSATAANTSLQYIDQQVNYGWLIHRMHNLAGTGLIVLGLAQIVTLFMGWQQQGRWIAAWFSGILLTLCAIGLSWSAIILDWSQIGYWRFKVEMKTIASIPLIGETLKEILTGGSISTQAIGRMFTIHSYVLSIGAVVLAIAHLASLLYQSNLLDQLRQPKQNP